MQKQSAWNKSFQAQATNLVAILKDAFNEFQLKSLSADTVYSSQSQNHVFEMKLKKFLCQKNRRNDNQASYRLI